MLKNKLPKQIQINSTDLFKISIKILDDYIVEQNIYFVLFLCYITVKEFSRNNQHLNSNAKIELSLQYAPDLLDGLSKSNIIDSLKSQNIKLEITSNETQVRDILNIYSLLISYKSEDKVIKTTKCFF